MVLSNIDLVDTIKNGFRKCGVYPLNPENVNYTKCIQNHSETLAIEFDIAIDILNEIVPNLRERAIDSDIVAEEIRVLKQMRKDIEISGNNTIQSGMYVINEEDSLLNLNISSATSSQRISDKNSESK